MQVVYHGSYCEVTAPEIRVGKYTKDFGTGFYCTILRDQAVRWASKFPTPVVNAYEYEPDARLQIKQFTTMTEEWLDFIIACRAGQPHQYDIVVGAMADDEIYNFINDLLAGNISRAAFWELAKFRHPTQQIAFCTPSALTCLRFVEGERL